MTTQFESLIDRETPEILLHNLHDYKMARLDHIYRSSFLHYVVLIFHNRAE
jgi:hypothetical protein